MARKHGITSETKKDKRNNKKLLTNRKRRYIIQSSTIDKRNKANKKHNFKSEAFRGALKANKIKYEASNCGYGLTHFEVFVNTSEIDILEGVLSTL